MQINPDSKEFSQIMTGEELEKLNEAAIEAFAADKEKLEKLQKHLKDVGYKEINTDTLLP